MAHVEIELVARDSVDPSEETARVAVDAAQRDGITGRVRLIAAAEIRETFDQLPKAVFAIRILNNPLED